MRTRLADIATIHQGLSLAGRGAGTTPGEWRLRMVESSNIRDNRLRAEPEELREIGVRRNVSREKHLLRPNDVLVTTRAGEVQAALVPPHVSRTVASITLLVVRPHRPEPGMGRYLWYFLTSSLGQARLQRQLTVGKTMVSLTATDLGRVEATVPQGRRLEQIVRLAEAQEECYQQEMRAADLMRRTLRDSIIRELMEPEKKKQEAAT